MTNEEKQLLLKDLCARLPYRPYVQLNPGAYNKPEKCWICGVSGEDIYLNVDSDPFYLHHFNILPYLRSMSSMTKEEEEDYQYITERWMYDASYSIGDSLDWLNEHHFDYRGLIDKGLAIEAPEGMY